MEKLVQLKRHFQGILGIDEQLLYVAEDIWGERGSDLSWVFSNF